MNGAMRSLVTASIALLLVSCGGSSPEPKTTETTAKPAPSEGAKPAGGADDSAKKAAAVEKMTADEASKGACDGSHQAAVDKLLADVEASMKGKTDDDGKPVNVQVVGKKVLALGSNAKSFEMTVTGRGTEVHVMGFGAKELSMDVLVGKEPATTMRSALVAKGMALDVANVGKVDAQYDSRQVNMKPGQPIVVKVTGQGCAGIISFLKQ
jgi:hypothetical protein